MEQFLGLPINAAAHGADIDQIIGIVHWLMFALFAGWGSFFVYTLYRFNRKRRGTADPVGVKGHASSYLEVSVAIFEGVLLIGFAFPIWSSRVTEFPPEEGATVVRVVAEQFAWNFHYPGRDGVFGLTDRSLVSPSNPLGVDRNDPYGRDDIVAVNQFNVPIEKPVIVRLSTKDVIHSFGLPLFRVKQDAIPGEVVRLWFKPTMTTADIKASMTRTFSIADGAFPPELGILSAVMDYSDSDGNVIAYQGYTFSEEIISELNAAGIFEVQAAPDTPTEVACAQLCGLGHYRMRGFMTVQTQEEFDAWLTEQESYILLDEVDEGETPAEE